MSRHSATFYYPGEILWNLDQKDRAIAAWREAVKRDPRHALVDRTGVPDLLRCGYARAARPLRPAVR